MPARIYRALARATVPFCIRLHSHESGATGTLHFSETAYSLDATGELFRRPRPVEEIKNLLALMLALSTCVRTRDAL